MPRPRRMVVAATDDRAIPTGRDNLVIPACPCGCDGLNGDCVVIATGDSTAIPDWGMAERLTLSRVRQGDLAELSVADMIYQEREEQMSRLDSEVAALVTLAEQQGFVVEKDGTKLKWTNPEGAQISTPTRVIGRGLQNVRSQLRRLGLEIPRPGKTLEQTQATAPEPDPATSPVADEPEAGDPTIDPFAALGVLTEFVQKHATADDSEWVALCADLEAERDAALAQRDSAENLINQIRTALTTTAPWQALPAIAALLGLSEEKSA